MAHSWSAFGLAPGVRWPAIARGALRLGGCDGLRVWTAVPVTAAGQMRDGSAFGFRDLILHYPTGREINEQQIRGERKARAHNGPGITRQAGAKRTAQVARTCRCYALLMY